MIKWNDIKKKKVDDFEAREATRPEGFYPPGRPNARWLDQRPGLGRKYLSELSKRTKEPSVLDTIKRIIDDYIRASKWSS